MVSESQVKNCCSICQPPARCAHCVSTHCVFEGVLGFLGWTALRLKHRRLGKGAAILSAGLPSIHLKSGLLPDLKAKRHQFRGGHPHRPYGHNRKPHLSRHMEIQISAGRHHYPVYAKLEPSHEILSPDPLSRASRMIPNFLPSPPAEKLAVRVRRKVMPRQYL